MSCPRCRTRRAKRHCPALGVQICSTCCGTGRLKSIECPPTCGYLATAQTHPAAAVRKQEEHDHVFFAAAMQQLSSQRQQELCLLMADFIARFSADPLLQVMDEDARQACEAVAATYETAGRGLIYEHRPQSLPAQRLATDLRTLLDKVGAQAGRPFESDATKVLRAMARAFGEIGRVMNEGPATSLEMIRRALAGAGSRPGQEAPAAKPPDTPLIQLG